MMKEQLADFDREAYADWIWRGLNNYYSESSIDEKMYSFDLFGSYIVEQESITEGIACVYEDYVPQSKQLLFRQAIGDVLRKQEKVNAVADPPIPKEAIRTLFYLIDRIRANEALDSFIPSIGNGSIGRKYPDLFYTAIAVLKSLAPMNFVYQTAETLINSRNFDDIYLFETVRVLIKCHSEKILEILLRYEPRLSELRKEILNDEKERDDFQEFLEDWAQFILSLVPKSEIWFCDFWEKADHNADQTWLFELTLNKKIPGSLILTKDEKGNLYINKTKLNRPPDNKDYYTIKGLREKEIIIEPERLVFDSDSIEVLMKKGIIFGPKRSVNFASKGVLFALGPVKISEITGIPLQKNSLKIDHERISTFRNKGNQHFCGSN